MSESSKKVEEWSVVKEVRTEELLQDLIDNLIYLHIPTDKRGYFTTLANLDMALASTLVTIRDITLNIRKEIRSVVEDVLAEDTWKSYFENTEQYEVAKKIATVFQYTIYKRFPRIYALVHDLWMEIHKTVYEMSKLRFVEDNPDEYLTISGVCDKLMEEKKLFSGKHAGGGAGEKKEQ